jgi:hypothetical protein
VIDSPTVAPFHAVLDHRKKPYHLMVLSAGDLSAETTLRGQPLTPNMAEALDDWDTFQIDGYSLILVGAPSEGVSPLPEQAPLPPTSGREAPTPIPGPATIPSAEQPAEIPPPATQVTAEATHTASASSSITIRCRSRLLN